MKEEIRIYYANRSFKMQSYNRGYFKIIFLFFKNGIILRFFISKRMLSEFFYSIKGLFMVISFSSNPVISSILNLL